jgi:hypothetical protein
MIIIKTGKHLIPLWNHKRSLGKEVLKKALLKVLQMVIVIPADRTEAAEMLQPIAGYTPLDRRRSEEIRGKLNLCNVRHRTEYRRTCVRELN